MSDLSTMEAPIVTHSVAVDLGAAFSDKLQDLTDSLNLLFIRNNASGRNKFRAKWPDVALHIFGEELIAFDDNGTGDHDRREKLEYEAGERRIAIKLTIAELHEKTVEKGILQVDYVEQVIDQYGPDISKLFYAEDIIERVRPGFLIREKMKDGADEDIKPIEAQPPSHHDEAAVPFPSLEVSVEAEAGETVQNPFSPKVKRGYYTALFNKLSCL